MQINRTTFVLALVLLGLLPSMASAQSWYNSSWLYRKAIVIDRTKVSAGPHTNYPVLISRADTDLQTRAQTDADDILFTSADGTTKLDHEVESYTSGTGTLVAWVEIPSLASATDTVVYMYYGNAAATSQQNVTGTWNANYRGVWHLNGVFTDSTTNAANGANTGTIAATGKISNGRGFVRSNGSDFITITGLMGSPTSFTLSAWATLTTADPNAAEIISIGDNSVLRYDEVSANRTSGVAYNGGGVWTTTGSGNNYAGTGWHYVVYTFDDAGNSQKLYVDGIQVGTGTATVTPVYTSGGTNTFIGKHGNANVNFDFDGTIDEVRVSNASRSVGWALTEFNNQNAPTTFYAVGGEAKTYYSRGTGNWNTAATWSNTGHTGAASSTVPGNAAGDYVIIGNSNTVTLDVNVANQTEVVINSTGTLNMGTNTISGAGAFTLNSGASLGVGSTAGITSSGATGNVQVTGTRTFSTGANYNYNGSSAQVTGNGLPATVNNLIVNNSAGVTLSATVAVSSDLTVTTGTLDLGSFTANRASAGGTLTVSNGATLRIGGTNTLPSNFSAHSIGATSTVAYGGTTQSVVVLNSAQNYGNLTISGSLTKTLAATISVAGDLTISAGTFDLGSFTANRASAGGTLSVASSATLKIGGTNTLPANYSTHSLAFVSTIEYSGTNQTVAALNSAQEYNGLTISGSGTKTLAGDLNVAGTVTLTSGTITTGANTLYIKATGNVFRVSGHVIGNLRRRIATGAPSRIFDVGDVSNYTPVTVVFASVTTAGDLTVSVASGDHANIGSSTINATKSVNRNWTLTNSGIVFTNYDATFTFVAGDVDGGASTSAFIVGKYSAGWTYPTVGTKTATSTQTTGLTSFSDFQLGEAIPVTKTWDGGAGTNNWGDAANWNTDGVPISTDDVNLTGANTININVAAVANNITLNNAGLTLTINTGSTLAVSSSLTLTAGTFNMGTNTVSGAGSFTLGSGGNLGIGSTLGITSSGATGNVQVSGTRTFSTAGNYTYNGTAAQVTGDGLPATVNNLTINNSAGVTLSANVAVSSDLTVTSGVFTVGAFSLAVTGTTTVTSTLTITSATGAKSFGNLTINGTFTNTAANAPITIAGDLQNNGTFSQGTGRVTFTGATSNTVSGAAATTAFGGGITVNKGVSNANVLDVTSVITMLAGGLTLTNGTFKLSSASTITPFTSDIAVSPFLIPSTAGLWCNGGTMNSPGGGMAWTVQGLIRLTAGTVNAGAVTGNYLAPQIGTSVIIEGGNLILADRMSQLGSVWTFNMTGGALTVANAGSNTADRPPFNMEQAGSSFSMSGGTIIIARPGGSAGQNLGYLNLATSGTGFTGGTLQIGNGSTPAASTIGITSTNAIYNLTVNAGSSTARLQTSALTVTNTVTISAGTLSANNLGLTIGGDWINNDSTTAFTAGTATVTFNGAAVGGSIGGSFATTFNSLTMNRTNGISLGANATAGGTLTFTSGNITTGSNNLYLSSTGTVSRTSGHVNGNFRKNVATGATSRTFEIGDATNYTPVTVAFASVTTAGDLTASVVAGDHANIGTSTINPSLSVNRNWTLTNSGIVFTNYGATFTFVAGDVDGGADTSAFIVGKYSAGWTYPTVGTKTATTTQATGLTAFSDFAIGEMASSLKTWDGGASTNNWGDAANWNTDGVPTSTNDVDLTGADTININVAAVANNLTLNNAGLTLTVNSGNSLTVSGNLTLTSGTLNTANAFPTVTGTVNVAGGTVGFTGSGAQTIPAYNYNNLTSSSTGGRTLASSGTIGVAGTFTPGTNTYTITGSTINYNAAAQTIAAFNYNNLTLSNSGAKTFAAGTSGVASTLSITGSATANATTNSSTISYNGSTNQTVTALTYYGLNVSSTGGTVTGINTTVTNFSINSGTLDLNTLTLTITGTSTFTAGTINNGTVTSSGVTTTFAGTTFGAIVNATSNALYLNGSTFNNTVTLTKNGATDILSNGGNTFNGIATIAHSGSGYLALGNTTADIFNGDVAFTNTGSAALYVAFNSPGHQFNGNVTFSNTGTGSSIQNSFGPLATAVYSGNIIVNNTSTVGISFGGIGGLTTLAATKTISKGATGFTTGTLYLFYFTQVGATPQALTLTGTATLTVGPSATFNGNVNFISPQVYLNGATFNGTVYIEKTGATQNNSLGGNVFNSTTTIVNSSSAHFVLGFPTGVDTFNGDVTFSNTGAAGIYPAYNTAGHQFNGNIFLNVTNNGTIFFCGGTGTATLATTKTISVGGLGFSSGALYLWKLTQLGTTAQTLSLTGTALLWPGVGSTFNGNVNFTAPQLLLNGSTYNGTASLTKNGASNNTSDGGNTFNSTAIITNSGTGFLILANTTADDFNADATFIQTGSGLLQPAYATNSTFAGNLSTTGTATAISFGTGAGTVTLNGAGAQSITGSFTTTFNNLTINNGSGITLGTNAAVNSVLTFTSGTVTTNSNELYLGSAGSVSRTSGHVVGNFKKNVATGATSKTFEIGDGNYTPVTVAFASVTTAGDLTARTTSGDHANIGTSTIDASKSVNRSWTLTNSGITFTTYGATFTFVAGDLDVGAATSAFIVGKYSSGWTDPTVGTRTSTSTQATGLTGFGDFQLGEAVPLPPSVVHVASVSPLGTQPPGTELVYSTTFTNSGGQPAQVFIVVDPIPANTDFKLGSVTTVLGTTGLTVAVEYSNDNAATWTYTPVSGGGGALPGYDRAVTHVRWVFTGNLSQTSPNNAGSVSVTARIR